jgi:hypothetical protein
MGELRINYLFRKITISSRIYLFLIEEHLFIPCLRLLKLQRQGIFICD